MASLRQQPCLLAEQALDPNSASYFHSSSYGSCSHCLSVTDDPADMTLIWSAHSAACARCLLRACVLSGTPETTCMCLFWAFLVLCACALYVACHLSWPAKGARVQVIQQISRCKAAVVVMVSPGNSHVFSRYHHAAGMLMVRCVRLVNSLPFGNPFTVKRGFALASSPHEREE